MGVSGHGSFFSLWAICARSTRVCALTEPWVTPPTAGAMKIKRGGACLHLLSQLCLASRPSCSVSCRISQRISLSLSLRLRPEPRPLLFIMPQPFVAPHLFGWLLRCPALQPPSRRNSAWCLGLHLLLILACDSIRRCLPPLPPPSPSRTTSPSPEREAPEHCCFGCRRGAQLLPARGLLRCCRCRGHHRAHPLPARGLSCHCPPHVPVTRAWPQGGSESKSMMFMFREHCWSWAKMPEKPVVLASCDKINAKLT
jgi:hypothetical protein